jgi:hypothetical protein
MTKSFTKIPKASAVFVDLLKGFRRFFQKIVLIRIQGKWIDCWAMGVSFAFLSKLFQFIQRVRVLVSAITFSNLYKPPLDLQTRQILRRDIPTIDQRIDRWRKAVDSMIRSNANRAHEQRDELHKTFTDRVYNQISHSGVEKGMHVAYRYLRLGAR